MANNTPQFVKVKFTKPKNYKGFISCFITLIDNFYIRATIAFSKKGTPYVQFPGAIKLDKKDENGNPVYWENVFASKKAKDRILEEYKKWAATEGSMDESKSTSDYDFLNNIG